MGRGVTRIGYLRVSTEGQRPDRQLDGLKHSCDRLYVETASAGTCRRPVYEAVLRRLKPGDTLVVWDLDRAFRSVVDAVTQAEKLNARSVELQIVNLQLDTRTPAGMLVYTVLSACAEFERRMIRQRTREGLAAARLRGKKLGRPRKLSREQLEAARASLASSQASAAALARELGVARWTLTRSLRRDTEPEPARDQG